MDDLGYAYVEYGSSGSEPEMTGRGYTLATFPPTTPGLLAVANFTLRGDSLRIYAQALQYGRFLYRQYPLEEEPPYEWTGGFAEFLARGSGELWAYANASVAYEYLYYHLFDPEVGLYWEVRHERVPDVIAETNLAKKAMILEPYYWWATHWVAHQ